MALTTKISITIQADHTNPIDLATATTPLNWHKTYEWTNGTGLDQADLIWHDTRQIAASGTDDLDLAGSLTNIYGATVTFTRIKLMLVYAHDTNTNNIEVGNAAANGFTTWVDGGSTARVRVRPGGVHITTAPDATGHAVTAGSADVLRLTNDAGSTVVDYDIVLIGTS